MSLRLDMLRLAGSSLRLLGDRAESVRQFLRSLQNRDGGFADRAGASDLYYTVFGLEGLAALGAPPRSDRDAAYLRAFDDGESLDFVHLCCLARCWADIGGITADLAAALAARLQIYRSADGAFHPEPSSPAGSAYGCFLAVGACEDLGVPLDADAIARCLESLKTPDGAFANGADLPFGTTPTTAAAVTILRRLGRATDPASVSWLESRCHHEGGFFAIPDAPIPDLLSTATALHALAGEGVNLAGLRAGCLDFVESLYSDAGAFRGNWLDDALDCEYTWYGLVAMGNLA